MTGEALNFLMFLSGNVENQGHFRLFFGKCAGMSQKTTFIKFFAMIRGNQHDGMIKKIVFFEIRQNVSDKRVIKQDRIFITIL
jgi:hypothetical protein